MGDEDNVSLGRWFLLYLCLAYLSISDPKRSSPLSSSKSSASFRKSASEKKGAGEEGGNEEGPGESARTRSLEGRLILSLLLLRSGLDYREGSNYKRKSYEEKIMISFYLVMLPWQLSRQRIRSAVQCEGQ
jgi:hypothetical protein